LQLGSIINEARAKGIVLVNGGNEHLAEIFDRGADSISSGDIISFTDFKVFALNILRVTFKSREAICKIENILKTNLVFNRRVFFLLSEKEVEYKKQMH
jgi:hypothetical protein